MVPSSRLGPCRLVASSAIISLLPLLVWWSHFAQLFFFADDWELLRGAFSGNLLPWSLQPFLGEGFLPLFKLIWIGAIYFAGGSYLALIVLLWLTHLLILILFGWLLERFQFPESAAAIAVLTIGLAWTNIETLGWAMQWGAQLAILFLLASWHLLLGIAGGHRWTVWYVLLLFAGALVSTRGVFYGVVMTLFIALWPSKRPKLALCLWSLLPVGIVTVATLLIKNSAPTELGAILRYATFELLLNPLYDLISYPGRSVGLAALLLFGAIKTAIIAVAIVKAKPQTRLLLFTLLALDAMNALALGYGRTETGITTTVSSRYQYISLLCFAPALGLLFHRLVSGFEFSPRAISKLARGTAALAVLAWLALITYPWHTHIGRWANERGRDLRLNLQDSTSDLPVPDARQLIQYYHLH